MSDKPGLRPRRAAVQALLRWENGQGFLGELLASEKSLSDGERALAMDISMGVCRQKLLIDDQIDRFCPKSPQPVLRQVLRVGLYQLAFMKEEIPPYSAVDTAVDLAGELLSKGVRGFVNAILRRFLREGLRIPQGNGDQDWSIRYSHPLWLVQKWRLELGDDDARARLESGLELPLFWIRRNNAKISAQEWRDLELHQTEYWERFGLTKLPLRQILSHDAFKQGMISLQDPSSWLMTRLLDLETDSKAVILDACAAPGGKTALLLEEFPGIKVISTDLKWNRLSRMDDLSKRLELHPELCCQNGLAPAFRAQSFDALLLDAPCSNLGVLGRRPEARWTINPNELKLQSDLQLRLILSLCDLVKVGGTLVYGTCSPESEETFDVISEFIRQRTDFEIAPPSDQIPSQYLTKGMMRVIPKSGGFDGFFGARLRRIR